MSTYTNDKLQIIADTIIDKIPHIEDINKEPGISLVKYQKVRSRENFYNCCQTH